MTKIYGTSPTKKVHEAFEALEEAAGLLNEALSGSGTDAETYYNRHMAGSLDRWGTCNFQAWFETLMRTNAETSE